MSDGIGKTQCQNLMSTGHLDFFSYYSESSLLLTASDELKQQLPVWKKNGAIRMNVTTSRPIAHKNSIVKVKLISWNFELLAKLFALSTNSALVCAQAISQGSVGLSHMNYCCVFKSKLTNCWYSGRPSIILMILFSN